MLISENSFTVYNDQFYNNTVISLVVANSDEILRNYGRTFGISSYIILRMNFKVEEMHGDSDMVNLNTRKSCILNK